MTNDPEARDRTVSGSVDTPQTVVVDVSVDGGIYRHLSAQAREELAGRLRTLAATVLLEAQSLESVDRARGANPEIIRAHVERSWWTILLRYRKERHPRLLRVLPLLSSLCVFSMGFSISHFKEWWGPIVFVIGTVLAAFCVGTIWVLAGES